MKASYDASLDKSQVYAEIKNQLAASNYEIAEENITKPWGGYFRINSDQADIFIAEYFPGLAPLDARLGIPELELSPKILIVAPGQRLSWQYHHRRAERWKFLSSGKYIRSNSDQEGPVISTENGDAVQFDCGERHRLIGDDVKFTIVAEIWQHTDPKNPSDEDDIVRLQDDYRR